MTYSQGNEVLKSREVESVTYYAQLVSAYLCMTVIGVQLDPSWIWIPDWFDYGWKWTQITLENLWN